MAKKKPKKETPKVNKQLEGFDIHINPFGEIMSNFELDKINDFLDKNVDDKKLRDRPEIVNKSNKKRNNGNNGSSGKKEGQ
jgi:hypothetical protein